MGSKAAAELGGTAFSPDAFAATGFGDPDLMLEGLEKADCEGSLLEFIKAFWVELEPERPFTYGRVIEELCAHLEAITAGKIKKLLINVPPGCMKSLLVSVFWPAWEWGPKGRPDLRYICASYSQDLTVRDNRRMRILVGSKRYQKYWGSKVQISADQDAKLKFETTARGWKIATSVGGAVVGERGDRFIIDDPHNIKDVESEKIRENTIQWFTEIVPTRVNDPEKAVFLVIMQRVHERDVSGIILNAANRMGYDCFIMPMEYEEDHPHKSQTSLGFVDWRKDDGELLWPERFNQLVVDELKEQLSSWGGGYAVAGQLQQRPVARGGGAFKRSYFQVVKRTELPLVLGGRVVRGWDLAASTGRGAKYTAGVKMRMIPGIKRPLIESVVRIKGSPHQVEMLIQRTAIADGRECIQDFPQDPGQAGKAQKMAIARLLAGYRFRFSPETGDKETRAMPLAAQGEAGNLLILDAEWTEPFIVEAMMFPAGQYSDQIDAASRSYMSLLRRTSGLLPAGPLLLGTQDEDTSVIEALEGNPLAEVLTLDKEVV